MKKNEKLSWVSVILSFIIGVGMAVLTGRAVMDTFSPKWVPIVIAVITISAEKIGVYLIYKFDVERVVEEFFQRWRKNKE